MNHLKLFENFEDIELKIEALDNWLESNVDYVDSSSLLREIENIFNLDNQLEATEKLHKDDSGSEYGEDWSKKLITITKDGQDLISIWLTPDMRYDYGKNTMEFGDLPKNKIKEAPFGGGARFFFDRELL